MERGVFDDVAMAMVVHPAPEETCASSLLAITDPANTSALYYLQARDVTQLVPDARLAAAYRTAITGLGRSTLSPEDEQRRQTGSTDMGPVSTMLPAIHPTIAIDCGDAVNHQPEFATACLMPSADRAVCDGALALALTALAAVTDDAQRDRLLGGVSRHHTVSKPPPEVHYDRAGFPSRHAAPPILDVEQSNRDVVNRRAD
ncbi:MAG: hypothetical protein ACRDTF_07115 [Pseudonocardiaceae bacterium]